jgi:AcrR family transcriptional regulator
MKTIPKRDRLVEAAKETFYHQGVARTTLADIAEQADIPLGNVYYHFRTKEALIEAVIQAHLQTLQAFLARLALNSDPRQRLLALVAAGQEGEQALVRYGCPHGSLCQELDKEGSQPASMASRLFQTYLDWAETQFRLLGKDEQEAKDFALDLISSLQGTFLLTNSFRSPELLERKLQRLAAWLRTV